MTLEKENTPTPPPLPSLHDPVPFSRDEGGRVGCEAEVAPEVVAAPPYQTIKIIEDFAPPP